MAVQPAGTPGGPEREGPVATSSRPALKIVRSTDSQAAASEVRSTLPFPGEFSRWPLRITLTASALLAAGSLWFFRGQEPSIPPQEGQKVEDILKNPPKVPGVIITNPVDSRSPTPPIEAPRVSPIQEVIQKGGIELRAPQEWQQYFEYVSVDELRSLLAKAKETNPAAHLFPQIDIEKLSSVTIKNQKVAIPNTGADFWLYTFNGLPLETVFRSNFDGEVWPGSIAKHGSELSGKQDDKFNVLFLPRLTQQEQTLVGSYTNRNRPGIPISIGTPLEKIRTGDTIDPNYLPGNGQAAFYIRSVEQDGSSSFTDAQFGNVVTTGGGKIAISAPGK